MGGRMRVWKTFRLGGGVPICFRGPAFWGSAELVRAKNTFQAWRVALLGMFVSQAALAGGLSLETLVGQQAFTLRILSAIHEDGLTGAGRARSLAAEGEPVVVGHASQPMKLGMTVRMSAEPSATSLAAKTPPMAGSLTVPAADLELPSQSIAIAAPVAAVAAERAASRLAAPRLAKPGQRIEAEGDNPVAVRSDASRYRRFHSELTYGRIDLRFMDERSEPWKGLVYPLGDLKVTLVGSELTDLTSPAGRVGFADLPMGGSRFLMRYEDPLDRVVPGVVVIDSHDLARLAAAGDDAGLGILVLRKEIRDAYFAQAGVDEVVGRGVVCASVLDRKGAPAEGVSVRLDAASQDAFTRTIYINRFGFADRSLGGTSEGGRLCMLNVVPGPLGVNLYRQGTWVSQTVGLAVADHHVDTSLFLGESLATTVRLASMPPAQEVLHGHHPQYVDRMVAVDHVEVIPLNYTHPMGSLGSGYVGAMLQEASGSGRAYGLTAADEFEPAVYALEHVQRDRPDVALPVVTLLPRGFVEEMSWAAQMARVIGLGTVVAHHGWWTNQGDADRAVHVALYSAQGAWVGQAWTGEANPMKNLSIVFNVPPGVYSAVVRTMDGFWVASDVVPVFSDTTTVFESGSPLLYQP